MMQAKPWLCGPISRIDLEMEGVRDDHEEHMQTLPNKIPVWSQRHKPPLR
jgi:hypothetical protein